MSDAVPETKACRYILQFALSINNPALEGDAMTRVLLLAARKRTVAAGSFGSGLPTGGPYPHSSLFSRISRVPIEQNCLTVFSAKGGSEQVEI
jgi:hypothetical protein